MVFPYCHVSTQRQEVLVNVMSTTIHLAETSLSSSLIAHDSNLLKGCLERLHHLTENHWHRQVAIEALKISLLGLGEKPVTYR